MGSIIELKGGKASPRYKYVFKKNKDTYVCFTIAILAKEINSNRGTIESKFKYSKKAIINHILVEKTEKTLIWK
jgi:hypothetical protein